MYRCPAAAAALALALATANSARAQAGNPPRGPLPILHLQSALGVRLVLTVEDEDPDTLETQPRPLRVHTAELIRRMNASLGAGAKLVVERAIQTDPSDPDWLRSSAARTWLVSRGGNADVTELLETNALVQGLPQAQLHRRRLRRSARGATELVEDRLLAAGTLTFAPAPGTPADPLQPRDNYLAGTLQAQQLLLLGVLGGRQGGGQPVNQHNRVQLLGVLGLDANPAAGVNRPVRALASGSLTLSRERPAKQRLGSEGILAPVAEAGDSQKVGPNALVTLQGSVEAAAPDQPIDAAAWRQIAGPRVELRPTTGNPQHPLQREFSVAGLPPGAELRFQLSVRDQAGASATDALRVTLTAPPTANAGPDATHAEGSTVTLNGEGSDPDGGAVSYLWAQTTPAQPPLALANATTAKPSFVAPLVDAGAPVALTFRLTVTDDEGQTATDDVTITVRDNQPPTVTLQPASVEIRERATFTVTARATDPDSGDVLTYKWEQTSPASPSLTLADADKASVGVTAPSVSSATTLQLRVTVTDRAGSAVNATVPIRVLPR